MGGKVKRVENDKKTIQVFNIDYCTDGDENVKKTLPKVLIFDIYVDETDENIADRISDETGYLVYSFEYETISAPKGAIKRIGSYEDAIIDYCFEGVDEE